MAGIRVRDTAPELTVPRIAHRMGLRVRIHRKNLPVRPDLVFPKHRLVVCVHGCFWHRQEACRHDSNLTSRIAFWIEKFAANVARDARQETAVKALVWRVLVIWERETRREGTVARRLAVLTQSETSAQERASAWSAVAIEQQTATQRVSAPKPLRSVPVGAGSDSRAASTL